MNYTPLDVDKIKSGGKNNKLNTLLLGIASFTSLVFAILLFVLIQKKMQEPVTTTTNAQTQEVIEPTLEPTVIIPTEIPVETITASPTATIMPQQLISPAVTATSSPIPTKNISVSP